MSTYLPYLVGHIHLNNLHTLPVPDNFQKGNYLVFWWKKIPLGHVFIKPNEKISEKEYYQRIITALQPTLDYYLKKQSGAALVSWPQWLLDHNLPALNTWLETILESLIPTNLPPRVPVSIIICTRNRVPELTQCLTSIQQMVCQPSEVIVVDNAPNDNSTETYVNSLPGIKYYKEVKAGLSHARNRGIRLASNAIVAFTDDDVEVDSEWIYHVWETFRDEQVAAMAGLVFAAELESESQYIFEKYWSFNRGYQEKRYDGAFIQETLPEGPPVWKIGAGANMAYRQEVFKEVGFFDERLGAGASGCNEDSEMWYRILLKGHAILYTPRAIVTHKHRTNLKALYEQLYSYMRGFTAAAIIQQHQNSNAGYMRHLFLTLPKYYFRLLLREFPNKKSRSRTVWIELKGMISGLAFYLKNNEK